MLLREDVYLMSLLEKDEIIRDGNYRIERFIGAGAFAEVYRVEHHIFGRQALKIFKTPGTDKEVILMLDEAKLLTKFSHPNIIRVYETGFHKTHSGTHGFFTMEFFESNLAAYRLSHKERFVPVPIIVDILRQLCLGLSLTHASRPALIHRDIKPQNILIEEQAEMRRVCISDFGLAKHVNPLTDKASVRGSLAFRAPECHSNPQEASCAADIYSLGVTIYLMLTDRFPYSGADLDVIKPQHFKQPLFPASRINAGVNERLDAILTRALAVAPINRYPNASAMLKDLEDYLDINEIDKPPINPEKDDNEIGNNEIDELTVNTEQDARRMYEQALELSRSNLLNEAADLLEKAMNYFPPYREEYQGFLAALRAGRNQ